MVFRSIYFHIRCQEIFYHIGLLKGLTPPRNSPTEAVLKKDRKNMSLRKFIADVYPPHLHLLFAASWVLSLIGILITSETVERIWYFNIPILVCIAVVFVTLFFLRAVDEWKDYDYDKIYKPEKPLVQGVITRNQLFLYMIGSSAIALGMSGLLSWKIAAIVALDMAWGLFLVFLEKKSTYVRNQVFVNLMLTYPVNIALSVCVYIFFLEQYHVSSSPYGVLVITGFAFAFLTYEFLRKAVWPHLAKPDELVYSTVIGGVGAIAICVVTAAIGCGIIAFILLRSSGFSQSIWLVFMPLLCPVLASYKYLHEKKRRINLAVYGSLFLLLFYGGLFAVSMINNSPMISGQ